MQRVSWPALGLIVIASVVGCTKPNPRDCTDGTCTDSAFPFCDQAGTFGPPQTCVAVTCTPGDFAACQGSQLLKCNATGNDYDVSQCEHGCEAEALGCVACLDNTQCANPTPTCDTASHSCRACQTDADCTSEVCDDRAGTCVDAASIIYAAPDGTPAGDCGSQAAPCTFDRAFALVDATHHTVKVRAGTYDATRPFSFTTNAQDELFFDGAGAILSNSVFGPMFEVLGSGRLRIKGFTFQLNPASRSSNGGISCGTFDTPLVTNLEAEDLQFTGDGDGLINIFSCVASLKRIHLAIKGKGVSVIRGGVVTIDQSLFEPSSGATNSIGLTTVDPTVLPNAQVHIVNSIFRNLSTDMFPVQGAIDIQFSTFVNIANPIDCTSDITPGGDNAHRTYSNSVFVRTDKQQVAIDSPCTFHDVIMFPQFIIPTHSDNLLFNIDPKLVDIPNGDYHLQPGSRAIDAADPNATEPIDFDGAKRPDGILRDLGAFEFHAP